MPFDGRMAFVPEGQADRSRARSACEIPTLNTPSPVAKRSFGDLKIFDGSKPMILPLSIERPSQRPISYAGLQGDGHGSDILVRHISYPRIAAGIRPNRNQTAMLRKK